MRVRTFGSGPVIGRQEQETQQRHAPEEAEPGCDARIAGSGSHGSSCYFLIADVLARGLFEVAAGSH